ncbi:hypothetical protein JZ751_016654 [Albula glossodonta]|uniref:Peroxisomal membrane protein PEX13 n=1 Tax=Albula glossodonta TaxID=121402 RepID=A0A8T2MIN2_9TELE|nr:hypothetical protein JZ751_016654 [Albula glossodonta]
MASQPPPKPWERRIPGTIQGPTNYQSTELGSTRLSRPGPPVLTRVAPPVPPRPVQQSSIGTMSSYRPAYSSLSSTYSPYGSSLYGGYSPYSYGMGGLGYNHFQLEDTPPSRFVQQAEESSRGAFQSIESIVHAFSSVSMMMDATFSAVYNSFRAVLDVANHFSRLKVHFTKVFSAFALVRTLRYLYRRLQRMLGLRRVSEEEDLWADSAGSAVVASGGAGGAGTYDPTANSVKSWPIFLFFAVILGGPYLIWKLLSSAEGAEEITTNWANGDDDHVVARAEFDFTAASEEEISIRAGDMLNLAPKEQQPRIRGWLLASLDGQATGLVPANYVKVLGKRRGRRQAELEAQTQGQQQQQGPPISHELAPSTNHMATPLSLADQEAVLESVYRETPASQGPLLPSIHPASSLTPTDSKIDL